MPALMTEETANRLPADRAELVSLMRVFAAFGMILHGFHQVRKDRKTHRLERSFIFRHLIVFALGVLVVVGGIVFCLM